MDNNTNELSGINAWFSCHEDKIFRELSEYLSIDTSLGQEGNAFAFLEDYLSSADFDVQREMLHLRLPESDHFSPHTNSVFDVNRANLRASLKLPSATEDRVLFNSHVDVVPATWDFPDAFKPKVENGVIYGRGACDTKGNLFMLVEAIRYMKENGIQLQKGVDLDLPIDEEIGGNGTLSTILHGVRAKEVIVLEPTDLRVFRGHRGCLSYAVTATGKAVHMGSDATGESAISSIIDIVIEFESLEKEMLKAAREHPDFTIWERPVQLNVGMIKGGEWSGSVPEKCEIRCDVGFMPDTPIGHLESVIRQRALHAISKRKGIHLDFDFDCGLRNEAYIQPKETPVAKALMESARFFGVSDNTTHGWCVSCDARHYDKVLGRPVVVFGAGSLKDAHSAHEQLSIAEMKRGMGILVNYLSSPPLTLG